MSGLEDVIAKADGATMQARKTCKDYAPGLVQECAPCLLWKLALLTRALGLLMSMYGHEMNY